MDSGQVATFRNNFSLHYLSNGGSMFLRNIGSPPTKPHRDTRTAKIWRSGVKRKLTSSGSLIPPQQDKNISEKVMLYRNISKKRKHIYTYQRLQCRHHTGMVKLYFVQGTWTIVSELGPGNVQVVRTYIEHTLPCPELASDRIEKKILVISHHHVHMYHQKRVCQSDLLCAVTETTVRNLFPMLRVYTELFVACTHRSMHIYI
jgi:hypothetical protein